MTEILEVLETKKTELVAKIATVSNHGQAAELGKRIEALDGLIAEFTPKPAQLDYYVIYRVSWQPESFGDVDAPMDREHSLYTSDDRITGYEMVEIGDASYLLEEHGVDMTALRS